MAAVVPAGLLPSSKVCLLLLLGCAGLLCVKMSTTGCVPVPERRWWQDYRTMEFGSSNFPSLCALGSGHTRTRKVCVCAHTHTHALTRSHWFSTPRPPHNYWMSPQWQVLASSCVLLFFNCWSNQLESPFRTRTQNIFDQIFSSCFGLALSPDNQFPFGICPNSKHHTHRNFRLLLHCAALLLLLVFVS